MTLQDTEVVGGWLARGVQWTDERVEALRRHDAAGLSASQIARELGGVTRNAVISKIHRLGMRTRKLAAPATSTPGAPIKPHMTQVFNRDRAARLAKPARVMKPQPAKLKIRPGHASSRAQEVQPIAATEIIDLAPDTSEFACTIHELGSVVERDRCRWPLGDPSADMHYCGAPSVGSWCARHRAIVSGKTERT